MPVVKQVMDAGAIQLAIARVAHEIAEAHARADDVVIVGIQCGGVSVAERLATELSAIWKAELSAATLDASMHRDDLSTRAPAAIHHTELPDDIDGKFLILVDDVVASGRTVRAALDALNSFGRPKAIQLAVLVDRGDRELPIQPDFCGKEIKADAGNRITVHLGEEEDAVLMEAQ
ncbi:MAG: bifunctional pyr operon transcriptional regulator/uracil phosphoribosyltransferase [Verrucomicrobiales bacterium]|nr:bifunctional pyr operon transcriptional regulator/uracil phosphoribosyltransferase [Verrucomicrobiales bacterium]|tara:strand:+ start:176 stop:703 length:528 start_codon:yes stop_codon:yes gene_type:complete